jgi:ABC-type spermidine/putrescine transport system permease subunit II
VTRALSARRLRAVGLGIYVVLVLAFLMLPVAVVLLASVSATSYLTVPPEASPCAGTAACSTMRDMSTRSSTA